MSESVELFGTTSSVNETENIFTCADRVSFGDEPRDISAIKNLYLPFDSQHKATHLRRNPFGAVMYKNYIAAGNVYHAFDGKRLVVELGCKTVIYLHINQNQPSKHHKLFIQSESAFNGDITIRKDAADIAKNTHKIETIVKYEMYFILGVLSVVSLPAWIIVTGSDVTYMYARNQSVANAADELSKTILNELSEIETYAPTLHKKILELIISENKTNAINAGKNLPKTIINDEKTQAQVSGIIFGKWAMPNGNPFNLWTLISTLLIQAAVKSVTKFSDAYLDALNSRYEPLIKEMKSINVNDPNSLIKPARALVELMKEAGVSATEAEVRNIFHEIQSNPDRAHKNLKNITGAILKFKRTVKR